MHQKQFVIANCIFTTRFSKIAMKYLLKWMLTCGIERLFIRGVKFAVQTLQKLK